MNTEIDSNAINYTRQSMHVACSIDSSIGIKLLCMQVTENAWNIEVDFVRFKKNKQMNSGAT